MKFPNDSSGGFLTGRFPSRQRFADDINRGGDRDSSDLSPPSSGLFPPPAGGAGAPISCWPNESDFGPLTLYRRRAMATDFEISVNDLRDESPPQETMREDLPFDALDLIDQTEEILSVFRPTSLASRINALAAEMDVTVPRSVFDRLVLCRRLWKETDGAFDITSSILWKVWGFARRAGSVPPDDEIRLALDKVGMERIRLDEDRLAVAFETPGTEINFGAIGKGIALDEAASLFASNRFGDYLIQGGMSSALARGGRSGDVLDLPDKKGPASRGCWTVGVVHPLKPEHRLAKLRLVDSALGTSGSGRQFFFHKGKRLSHIIDPKTGYPATGVLSATVLAPTAAEADALSTAFFVMGADRTEQFCRNHPDNRALLILDRKKGSGFDLAAFNLPSDFFQLTDSIE